MPTDDRPTPPPDGDDRSLLARVAAGDRSALEQLYRRHAPWLTARLQSRCGDADLADLAVQDTFVAVWRGAKRYRSDGDVGAWIWGIGIRRLIDQLRKRSTTPIDPSTITEHTLTVAGTPTAPSPEDSALAATTEPQLEIALARLAPELRAVLIATAIDGLSTKEAARLLGIPRGTVKTRAMRARNELRAALATEVLR